MAEQFANLLNTTLAVPYVAGSGSMTVSSAAGFPAGGTFCVTLLDSVTKNVLMIFRVSSRAGAVLTGVSEGPDVNCPSTSLVKGTMLTAAAMTQVEADAVASAVAAAEAAIIPGAATLLKSTGAAITAQTAAVATAFLNAFTSALQGLAPASGGGVVNFLRADGSWAVPAGGVPGAATLLKSDGVSVSGQTAAVATAFLNLFTSALQGLVPASGGGVVNFLRADGSWAIPAGGGGGGYIQTLTPPVPGSFTQQNYNVGIGVVTQQVNNVAPVASITIIQNDPTNTQNIVALDKVKIAATFTVTVAISIVSSAQNNLGGLWLSDGGAGPNCLVMGFQSNNGARIPVFTNFTTFAGDVIGVIQQPSVSGLLWLRIQETVALRIYSISSDGINFSQLFSEVVTAHFVTARYGFAVECRGSNATQPATQLTAYSFTET